MTHQKPKIIIVSDTYYPLRDGVLKSIEEFIKRTKKSFDLTFLVPRLSRTKIDGIKTIFFDISSRFKFSIYPVVKISFQNLKRIKEAIKQNDIVLSHGPGLAGFIFSLRYARKFKKKKILYIHNTAWHFLEGYFSFNKFLYRMAKKFFVRLYNRWDLLIIPYHELEEELRAAGIKTKIEVARLGVDINHFLPTKDKLFSKAKLKLPNKIVIGYVGRICQEKNTLVLLKAFNKLDPEKYFLLMVGDGNPEIVKKFKEHKNCLVTGFVSDVKDYLQSMDVFVMPSLTETTSLATLEAMACGLPVIVTKVGYMKEYIIKDYNGIFFPRANPTLLALKIEKLFRNPEFIKKLSQKARKTVAYSFSWERSANKVKRILFRLYYKQ